MLKLIAGCLFVAVTLFAQTPTVTGVFGEGGGSTNLCPGGVAFVSGTNLAGKTVTVAAKPAFIVNSSNVSLQIQLPVGAPLGATTLTVGTSAPFAITLIQFAPSLATDGLADDIVGGFHAASQAPISAAVPAAPGEQIYVIATGLGPTTPAYATGTAPGDTSAIVNAKVTVTVAGTAATVSGATNAPNSPGFYEVTFTVPPGLTTGNRNMTVGVGTQTSPAAVLPVSTAAIVATVTNAASYNDPALPNGPVAQGSIFVVKGLNLGPATLTIAPSAFQNATLSGTSLSVTIGGVTVAPLLYYTSAGQVAALMPSNTPVGTGTITATYNSQVGPAHPITVVASNLGIFTVTSDGQGAGVVTYADYSLVSTTKAANCGGVNTTCGAANPGDALIVWATGLGPISGSDAAGAGLGVNQTSVPLTIWLGGVQVPAVYQGRSGCCVGEDQIVFTVPANAPTGCATPLTIQINSLVSNTVALPIAAAGTRTCTPVNSSFSTASITAINTGSGPYSYGGITLKRNDDGGGAFDDSASAQFIRFTVNPGMQPFFFTYADDPPAGTCMVSNNTNGSNTPLTVVTGLDAGPQIAVQGPNGSKSAPGSGGYYQASLSANGTYFTPGAMTVSAPGGVDVAQFSMPFSLPALPSMTSPQPGAANPIAVTRANGLTVTWTGGSNNSYIELDIYNSTDNTGNIGAAAVCTAATSAGSFTIPASVLLAMPAGSFGGLDFKPAIQQISLGIPSLTASGLKLQYDNFTPLNFK